MNDRTPLALSAAALVLSVMALATAHIAYSLTKAQPPVTNTAQPLLVLSTSGITVDSIFRSQAALDVSVSTDDKPGTLTISRSYYQ